MKTDMIANLTQTLRQRFPMLWNIRIVPIGLIILALHAFLFTIGFVFQGQSLEFIDSDSASIYFLSFISGLLVFIGWLMLYSRNNGFRFFAPRSITQLWCEWVLILLVICSLCVLPLTYTAGAMSRIYTGNSVSEAQANRELLDAVQVLMPYDTEQYRYIPEKHQPIPLPKDLTLNPKELPMDDYAVRLDEKQQLTITGYKGLSLLFFHYPEADKPLTASQQQLLAWLKNGQSEPILALMTDYQALLKKYQRQMSRSPETWLKDLNQPPFFIVTYDEELIDAKTKVMPSIHSIDYNEYRDWEALSERQNLVLDQPTYRLDWLWTPISLAVFWGLILSIAVFSFRLSNGKTWLKAALSAGILLLFGGFIGVSHSGNGTFSLFWTLIWLGSLGLMYYKCRQNQPKGLTNITMHFIFWLPPWLLLVLFDFLDRKWDGYFFKPFGFNFLTTVLIGMALLMPCLIALVRRWKALPEA